MFAPLRRQIIVEYTVTQFWRGANRTKIFTQVIKISQKFMSISLDVAEYIPNNKINTKYFNSLNKKDSLFHQIPIII